jgi:hypothetical protein
MEEETEKTIVEESLEENESHESVSSTDEEELEYKTQEELIDEVKRERAAKHEAIRHLREQAKKRKEEESSSDQVEESDDEKQDVRAIIRQELKQESITKLSKGSDAWLREHAKDLFEGTDQSDELYIRVKKHAQLLADSEDVESKEDYYKILGRAHAAVTGKVNALQATQSIERTISEDKGQSAGYRGSTASKPSQSYKGFSQADMVVINRINERRAKQGLEPIKPSEITKQ